ncbi:MAG: hypothetical protein EA381_00435, partial [Planctomycetaceae bacterium]
MAELPFTENRVNEIVKRCHSGDGRAYQSLFLYLAGGWCSFQQPIVVTRSQTRSDVPIGCPRKLIGDNASVRHIETFSLIACKQNHFFTA